jgi:effector-binding domain-containing protein
VSNAIQVTTAEARPTAVLGMTTTWQAFPSVWRPLLDEVHAGVRWAGDGPKGRNVMVYLDDAPTVEVGVELDQPAELTGRLVRSALPAGTVATMVHRGPYGGLRDAHEEVRSWCAARAMALAGPRWEIYGHWSEDPAKLETEVYYLLR